MRIAIGTLGAALALFSQGMFGSAAHAQQTEAARQPRAAPVIRVPVVRPAPYWDGYIVPRYRYRTEDDRVDPCGGPVVPVIRVGPQRTNRSVVASEFSGSWPHSWSRLALQGP